MLGQIVMLDSEGDVVSQNHEVKPFEECVTELTNFYSWFYEVNNKAVNGIYFIDCEHPIQHLENCLLVTLFPNSPES
jgi:hypothetical protein